MAESPNESILRFENVSVSFDEAKALDNVSFAVNKGDTIIIFGAAGSGKSVLLKTALGLLKPSAGRVYLFDQDVTDLNEHAFYALRGKIGVLFQEGGLFDSMTIQENVSYPLENQIARQSHQAKKDPAQDTGQILEKVTEILRFVELEKTLEKFPSELSGGMRRRVGIARAAVTQPPLMLYDSPTAGLDPITANTIIALIVKARDVSQTTSIIVTHRYQDGQILANFRYNATSGRVEHVDGGSGTMHAQTRFMVFQQGKIVFEGTQEELANSTDPYVSKFSPVKN